jgi:nucleotide-binding universal stress UspA family protein
MSRIVVGVDGSLHADRALRWAVREATVRDTEIELVHGYVLHPHAAMIGRSDHDLAEARMDAIVERNRSALDRTGNKWIATVVPLTSGPTAALVNAGRDADLIVVGSRGLGGFAALFLGATSYHTAAHASTPVAVIRDGEDRELEDATRPVVVGIDGARASRRALRWALEEARHRGVGLTVVHAYRWPVDPALATVMSAEQFERCRRRTHDEAAAVIDRALDDLDVPADVDVERVIAPGSVAGVLLERAAHDRLLVMGTRGRNALGRAVFGSVSHQCLHHARGPVIVVP